MKPGGAGRVPGYDNWWPGVVYPLHSPGLARACPWSSHHGRSALMIFFELGLRSGERKAGMSHLTYLASMAHLAQSAPAVHPTT